MYDDTAEQSEQPEQSEQLEPSEQPGSALTTTTRLGLFGLAASVFAGVTTEMLPVGLLPDMAQSLGRSEAQIGLLVGIYAAMVALLSVPLAALTRRVPRKRLLMVTVGCYALSNLVCAIAPGFAVLAFGRAIGGATHALFFAVAIGYGSRLAPPAQTGRAPHSGGTRRRPACRRDAA